MEPSIRARTHLRALTQMHSAASTPPPLINSVFAPQNKITARARTATSGSRAAGINLRQPALRIMGQEATEQLPNEEAEDGGRGGLWMMDTDVVKECGMWKRQKKNVKKDGNLILKPEFLRIPSRKAPIRIIYSWSEYGRTDGHGSFTHTESLLFSLKDEQRHIVMSSVSRQ